MSAEVQRDVSPQYSMALNEIEPAINGVVGMHEYGSLKLWAVIAIIRAEDHEGYNEVKKYRKKSQEFEFRLKIEHAAFKAADCLGKRKLIMASILRSINEMRKLIPHICKILGERD